MDSSRSTGRWWAGAAHRRAARQAVAELGGLQDRAVCEVPRQARQRFVVRRGRPGRIQVSGVVVQGAAFDQVQASLGDAGPRVVLVDVLVFDDAKWLDRRFNDGAHAISPSSTM